MTEPAHTKAGDRDVELEQHWLKQAERAAGRSGFAQHVAARLEAGAAAYGDRWSEVDLDHLLIELAEEAADLGGWGVLALQALKRERSLSAAAQAPISRLERAIAYGARAHYELVRARLELKRARAAAHARTFGPDRDPHGGRHSPAERYRAGDASLDRATTAGTANEQRTAIDPRVAGARGATR